MFTPALEAVAVLSPVAPALAWTTSAASTLALFAPASTSYRSVMPVGDMNVAAFAMPKKPTMKALATLVVIEGAVTDTELALARPPEVSTGVAVSTPL